MTARLDGQPVRPNRDAIARALQHHELRGVVRSWSPPESRGEGARTTWIVNLYDVGRLELNGPSCNVLLMALAAAETRALMEAARSKAAAGANEALG